MNMNHEQIMKIGGLKVFVDHPENGIAAVQIDYIDQIRLYQIKIRLDRQMDSQDKIKSRALGTPE